MVAKGCQRLNLRSLRGKTGALPLCPPQGCWDTLCIFYGTSVKAFNMVLSHLITINYSLGDKVVKPDPPGCTAQWQNLAQNLYLLLSIGARSFQMLFNATQAALSSIPRELMSPFVALIHTVIQLTRVENSSLPNVSSYCS